ncbi:transcription termination/antitermination protein NusG [Cohaesibacter gelatinilyticus]|uniref:Transcription antitermination factor NusG n=1 Tax=Cohaesibacter gelatinilyticus TaxID=372072 RepID=A0A285PNK1_9HYPH|nr:transcription termination/antitermination NusG family protein [Cohaesibacter gelatinilyticus]SNZ21706.1 Transcription antitermination factor NusG [Cohaesibacter gelatinilyticus]
MKIRDINTRSEQAMQGNGYHWFMGYVKPTHEMKSHAELYQREFVSFLPVEKVRRKNRFAPRNAPKYVRERIVDKAAFAGCIYFAMPRFDAEMEWLRLRDAKIFSSFVIQPHTGRAARIPGNQMQAFVDFNRERFSDQEKPANPFKIGDNVKTIDAALAIDAEIMALNGNRAVVEVDFMGTRRPVEIPLDRLEKREA